jgi:hypothetical protein
MATPSTYANQILPAKGNDLITIKVLDPTIQTRKMRSIKTEGKRTH